MRDTPKSINAEEITDYLAPLLVQIEDETCPATSFTSIQRDQLPAPYRQLLDHSNDMTSTLEQFFQDRIYIQALRSKRETRCYSRQVSLRLKNSQRVVEYGGIEIFLDHFPPAAQGRILEEQEPLGSILNSLKIPYVSLPNCFISTKENSYLHKILPHSNQILYGRCNTLTTPAGEELAHIVEILPALLEEEKQR